MTAQSLTPKPAEAPSGEASHDEAAAASAARRARATSRRRRLILMLGLPIALLLAGGYFWFSGGRYVVTDNAYVQQNRLTVYPEISGAIAKIGVTPNSLIHKGDMLFQINPEPFKIALDQADAAVAAARLQVAQLRAAYKSALAVKKAAEDNLAFRQGSFQRQQDLFGRGVSSQAAHDLEENNLHAAELQLAQAVQQVESARSALAGNPEIETDQHPAVMQALASRQKAALDIARTIVKAPADGVVAQTDRLQVGQYITPATAVLSLVEIDQTWVEANFKETDLTYLAVGQRATVTLDAYPGRSLDAVVESIGAGTGSQFSILPAQNATGNWVKVVQRLPVRLRLIGAEALPFRSGLSASVEVDTLHHRALPFLSANAEEAPPPGQFAGAH